MKLLVLGGTRFIGRHIVETALDAGHDVTLFNRGQSNPELFPQVRTIIGDRDGGMDSLRGDTDWDAVIDTCGYVPRVVKQSADLFAQSAALYVYISTVNVYEPPSGTSLVDERTPVKALPSSADETITPETYGSLKAASELVIRDAFPTRALFIRPGIVVGPYDPTDRFSYWVHASATKRKVIVPGDGTQPVQIIDARDLAQWIVKLAERQVTGFYNAVGPAVPVTMKRLIHACLDATNNGGEVAWLNWDDVTRLGYTEENFPLAIANRDDWWIFSVDPARAISAGLTLRPLSVTINDTLSWLNALAQPFTPKVGLPSDADALLLGAIGS